MSASAPREMLGAFLGLRGRHMRDTGRTEEAEADYLLARWLFPTSRRLYIDSMVQVVRRGTSLFEPGEVGSPQALPALCRELSIAVPHCTPEQRNVRDIIFMKPR